VKRFKLSHHTNYIMEPTAQPQMSIDFDRIAPDIDTHEGTWTHGLFDCFGDFSTFFTACACPCITHGRLRQKLLYKRRCWPDCFFYSAGLAFGCCGVIGGITRTAIREHWNVDGTYTQDYCSHCLCAPCALTQEYRQMFDET
jgi:Cys-rich protein (TIGR01571 family)